MTTQARELAKLVTNAGDVNLGDDISLASDGAVLNFGADSDVTLTHVADTGLLLNSSRQLQFGDSGTFIRQEADGVLDLTSDTEIELNATTLDINANVDISGTLTVAGNLDFGDAVLSNVGAVQLDSIAGDGDTNTSITFSGSDVITIATGGSGRLTIGDGALSPVTDNQIDLGTSSLEFKDGYFDGTVTADAFAGPLTGDVTTGGITISGSGSTITDSSDLGIVSGGILTVDVTSNIVLDAGGGQISFKDDGTEIGVLENASSDFKIESKVSNKDIIFAGNDGGTGITPMKIDMSEGGNVLIGPGTDRSRKFVVEGTGDLMALYSTNAGAGGAQLDLIHDSASYADDDSVRIVNFSTDDRQLGSIKTVGQGSGNRGVFHIGVRKDASNYTHDAVRVENLTHATFLDIYSPAGSDRGEGYFRFKTDGSSTDEAVAQIYMEQGSGDGS